MDRFCLRCGQSKALGDFYERLTKTGRHAIKECRDCYRKRLREGYRVSKERVDAIKLAAGCMDCGYNAHAEALEFDHRPGEVKVAGVAVMVTARPWAEIEAEMAKCDIVCANCHRVRTTRRMDARKNQGWDRVLRGADPLTGDLLDATPPMLPFDEAV